MGKEGKRRKKRKMGMRRKGNEEEWEGGREEGDRGREGRGPIWEGSGSA